jgi:transcriptional regulator with XRE-family HTH domain
MTQNRAVRDIERLRRALVFFAAAKGIGLDALALAAGINPTRLETILRGESPVTPIEALRLAMELDTTPDRLFQSSNGLPAIPQGGMRFYRTIANAIRGETSSKSPDASRDTNTSNRISRKRKEQ